MTLSTATTEKISETPASPSGAAVTCYYDQDCGICTASVEFLRRKGADRRVEFIGNSRREAFRDNVPEELLARTMVVVDRASGRMLIESRGMARLLAETSFPWNILQFVGLPGLHLLSNVAYRLVASNRTRISAVLGQQACGVPSATESPRSQEGDRGSD